MTTLLQTISESFFSIVQVLGVGAAISVAIWAISNRRLIRFIRTLPRDMKALYRFTRVMTDLLYFQKFDYTIGRAFDDTAKRNPKKILLRFENQSLTAEEILKLSNQVANYFQSLGLKKGDTVCLFMENCILHSCIWLGLSKIGVVSSLVNYNLRLQPLKHCIEAVNCKAIIYSPGLSHALEELVDLGDISGIPMYCVGPEPSQKLNKLSKDLISLLDNASSESPIVKDHIGFLSPLILIFTSGTTGLPKAATIKHSRYFMAAVGNFYVHGINKNDILYTAMPLYHGAGTMLGAGNMLIYGLTQVIRKRFSASQFWDDCIKYKVTTAQYIGEICRYLYAQPEKPVDKAHSVRVMFGNGLKAEMWTQFAERFKIKHISELYGATEGNCNMVNIDDTVGAVGFLPIWYSRILPITLIKVDDETGEAIRDKKTGFAIKCKYFEPGELIGKIRRNHPIVCHMADFEGYADKNSSQDKILHSAFRKGDSWFRSGDILVMDDCGYFYFKDRKGDTFRWKGENCSTTEIEVVISSAVHLQDVVVFGVEIPFTDGKAGMAVIADPESRLNIENLGREIIKVLPNYARPVFIRVSPKLEITGTFKLTKKNYQAVGYNIHETNDKIYFLKGNTYVEFTTAMYNDIMSGKLKC